MKIPNISRAVVSIMVSVTLTGVAGALKKRCGMSITSLRQDKVIMIPKPRISKNIRVKARFLVRINIIIPY
ncbi:MAG: hypothetical protein KJ893_03055 [Candidatus Omnitrophica bacterium]|nr:hypothetical protein [Candidatus Omnitrophota bacterium]